MVLGVRWRGLAVPDCHPTRSVERVAAGVDLHGLVDEGEDEVAAGGVPADVGDFDVEAVVTVWKRAGVESACEPDSVEAGPVGFVLPGARRVDVAEVDIAGRLTGDPGDERGSEVGRNPPGHVCVGVSDEPPAHECGRDRHSVPGRLRR